jgi:hypothetical protein
VWGQQLIDAITSRNTDTANAAGTDAQTKATTALNSAKSYVDGKVGASTLILGPQDAVPANTPAGTVIFRTT